MLPIFCLRLAVGMLASLLLISPAQIQPRFFRVHFLVVFGLATLVLTSIWASVSLPMLCVLGLGLFLAFAGSFSWSLENAPGGRSFIVLTTVVLALGLILIETASDSPRPLGWLMLGDLTSALVLGTTLSAMLLGHHYLVAPTMSIRPLLTLLAGMAIALVVRMAVDAAALAGWTGQVTADSLESDRMIWLPARWLIGFAGPLALTWMAWQTAKIRSTQSATGILYVVVIFTFLGELTSQLLRDKGVTL